MGKSQRGETIVGMSEDYKETMPKAAQRGPSKTPLKAKLEAMEAEVKTKDDQISKMQMMMLEMQQTLKSIQNQQTAQALVGNEKPKK